MKSQLYLKQQTSTKNNLTKPSTGTVVWSHQEVKALTELLIIPARSQDGCSQRAYWGWPGSWLGQRGSRTWFLFSGWDEMFLSQLAFLPLLPAESVPKRAPFCLSKHESTLATEMTTKVWGLGSLVGKWGGEEGNASRKHFLGFLQSKTEKQTSFLSF